MNENFPSLGPGKLDYSGYESESLQLRDVDLHRRQCRKVFTEATKSRIQTAQSAFGVRYSCLLELTYFDPVRSKVIDVMHNLFLGKCRKT